MDAYDGHTPQSRERRPAPGGTPIYDRLVAEWLAAGRGRPLPAHQEPGVSRGGFVPAARASGEAAGG
ncbi:hypothetical protein [Streptomyces pratensis]|uniref:hypothetical protein n=1 Tax=Streptomyces pratensis TaxID=1169025 RepID=UPI00301A5EE5